MRKKLFLFAVLFFSLSASAYAGEQNDGERRGAVGWLIGERAGMVTWVIGERADSTARDRDGIVWWDIGTRHDQVAQHHRDGIASWEIGTRAWWETASHTWTEWLRAVLGI